MGIGIEAVSLPVATKHLPNLLTAFFKKFEIDENNYSERCSTHVHFNVEPLTFSQVAAICLLYQTMEDLLFLFAGEDRKNNIFCVPWNQCNLSYNIVSRLESGDSHVFHSWQKYSALNLIPSHEQGTMEFRHLPGTCDVEKITTWVAIISKMFEYAINTPLEKIKLGITLMNTVSNYQVWMEEVFGEYLGSARISRIRVRSKRGRDHRLVSSHGRHATK
jgi:hypothetical protein